LVLLAGIFLGLLYWEHTTTQKLPANIIHFYDCIFYNLQSIWFLLVILYIAMKMVIEAKNTKILICE